MAVAAFAHAGTAVRGFLIDSLLLPHHSALVLHAPVLAATAALALALALYYAVCAPALSKRGFGSRENNAWNRRIRTDLPVHVKKHYQLEKQW